METRPEAVEEGQFDRGHVLDELEAAASNYDLDTTLWFETIGSGYGKSSLEPGERGPFHANTTSSGLLSKAAVVCSDSPTGPRSSTTT